MTAAPFQSAPDNLSMKTGAIARRFLLSGGVPAAMIRQFELVERVKSYDPNADEDAINRAYVFSVQAHGSQKRASGDPYFSHPVEVAGILATMKLDAASIITGLLHDTVEDTVATLEDIERLFGKDIARLVDGVTKLSRIELQSDQTKQAENFRKLVLAMSEDIRVLLVKLADRLHNMQTLHFIKAAEKRRRIARETMDIYAPLAERIGIHQMKDKLEDLAFGELHPDARERRSLAPRLPEGSGRRSGQARHRRARRPRWMRAASRPGSRVARRRPIRSGARCSARTSASSSSPTSWPSASSSRRWCECYQALGVIHSHYPVVPGRFKDYTSTPKPNGYRSLHSGVIGPERQRIEVQIRTREMHEVAELGVAAHWSYKQDAPRTEGKQYRWLRELLDILEHAPNPEEFLEHTKLEMFQDQVFCFTPKGDLIALPRGATPVDFAYAVHSQIGDTCVGAKINGRIMPLRTALSNGDQVEIITSRAQTPSPTWERFVVTGKARARIRRFIRAQQRAQYMDLGKEILIKAFRHENLDASAKRRWIRSLKSGFQAPAIGVEDLYAQIGEGLVTKGEVINAVYPNRTEPKTAKNRAAAAQSQAVGPCGADPRPHPRHGAALCRLLPSAAGRPHCRHRDHRQGRHDPHHRLRDAGKLRRYAGALARRRLGQ